MKTIYSILYIPLNTALDERLSIGMIMSDGENFYFRYSLDKLNAIKGIIGTDRNYTIKAYLKSIEKDVNINSEESFFYKEFSNSFKWVTEKYLSYLSKYSNNLIQFSNPKSIDVTLNEENFKRLFEKYIFKYETEIKNENQELDVVAKVKKCLYPTIEEKVNIDITLTSSNFENLFAPIEVNFFGINGVPVAGQTFDFDKKHYFLENDVSRYVSLTKALELEVKKNGKYFVLGREPKKINTKNHNMWEHIRDSDFLEFIDIDEYGIIEDYITNHNVRPFYEQD